MANITLTPIIEGTLAKASEVMGNFQAIADEVNGNLDGSNLKDNIITSAKIVDGAVTDTKLANLSVGTVHISNGAVTADKLAPGAVEGASVSPGSITEEKLATDAVTGPKIKDRAVTTAKLDNLAVTGGKIANGAVATDKIDGFAVTNPKLGDDAVNSRVLATNAVLAEHIKNGEVTNDKVASGISASKLTTGTLPSARIGNGTITPQKTTFMWTNGAAAQIYAAKIPADAGATGRRLPTGWEVRVAGVDGFYRIIHNLGTTDYVVAATIADGVNGRVMVTSKTSTRFDVLVFNPAGEYVGAALDLVVLRY